MLIANRIILLSLFITVCACAKPVQGVVSAPANLDNEPQNKAEVVLPMGKAVTIDGKVEDAEWADALRIPVAGSHSLLLKQHAGVFYLGFSGYSKNGFACLLVHDGDAIRVLHASAQTGSAVYRQTRSGSWNPVSPDYVWKKDNRLWAEDGWKASEGFTGAQEFAVSAAVLGVAGDGSAVLAFGYWSQGASALEAGKTMTWPETSDDCGHERLLSGWNPENLRFDTGQWMRVKMHKE